MNFFTLFLITFFINALPLNVSAMESEIVESYQKEAKQEKADTEAKQKMAHQKDIPENIISLKDMRDFLVGNIGISIENKMIRVLNHNTKAYKFNIQSLKGICSRSRFRLFKGPITMNGFNEGPVMVWQILKPFYYEGGLSGLLIHYVEG